MTFNALMQLGNDTKAVIQGISDNNEAVHGQYYFANDTDEYGYGRADGTIRWATYQGGEPVQDVADTDSVTMTKDANGIITANVQVSPASNNILVSDANGLSVSDLQIAPDSQSRLSYDAASRTIAITALGMTKVHTNTTEADKAAFIAAEYANGDEFQEGDVVILTQDSKAYIHNGGTAGSEADFTLLETPDLNAAEIQALFSSGNPAITYANGVFTLQLDPDAANDLSITANGLMLDVSAASVTDTNNILGGGAVDVTLQAFLDGIKGEIEDSVFSFDLESQNGNTHTMQTDQTMQILGSSILETSNAGPAVTVGFKTDGAAAGQVVKLVDINGTLTPEWGLDSASGFTEFNIPFAAADGTLTEDDVNAFKYFKNEGVIQIGKYGSGDVSPSTSGGNYTGNNGIPFFSDEGILTEWLPDGNSISNPSFYTRQYDYGGTTNLGFAANIDVQKLQEGVTNDTLDFYQTGARNSVFATSANFGDGTSYSTNTLFAVNNGWTGVTKFSTGPNNWTTPANFAITNLGGRLLDDTVVNGTVPLPVGTEIGQLTFQSAVDGSRNIGESATITTKVVDYSSFTDGTQSLARGEFVFEALKSGTISNRHQTVDLLTVREEYVQAHFYPNTRDDYFFAEGSSNVKNLLFTDADGKLQSLGVGAVDDVLKVVEDGNGVLSMKWVADDSGTFVGAGNGLYDDNGTVKLGANPLTEDTTINLDGNAFKFEGTATDKVTSTLDIEFLNSNVGTIYTAQDNTKWRMSVHSYGNGTATPSLTQIV